MPVYVVAAGDTNRVKIGYAKTDAADRLRVLQSGCWEPLRILRVLDGDRTTETALHKRFADQRISRDWFQFHEDMLTVDAPPRRSAEGEVSPLLEIVKLFGGQTQLGAAIGRKQSVVSSWLDRGFIPSRRILEVIEAARRLDPPVQLRPDHFFGFADISDITP